MMRATGIGDSLSRLAQLALSAAAWLAGYLTYLRAQRERAHG